MSASEPSPRAAAAEPAGAEGVPIFGYALAVARWWRELLASSAAAALFGVAGIWSLELLVPRYAASADVAIIETGSRVALDQRFQAVDGRQNRTTTGRAGRRVSLVGLAHQADVAESAYERLQGDLDEDASPARLLTAIEAELVTVGMAANRPQSDLIRLTAFASSPAVAKALADVWAEVFVEDVNALFADVPRQVSDTIAAELASARARYEEAEAKLQKFLAASRISLLEQEIAAKDAVIQEVISTWRLTATAAFQKDMTSRLSALDEDFERLRKARTNLQDARGLRLQLGGSDPSSVASNGLAIHLFKARMVTDNPNLEIRLGELPAVSAAAQREDMDFTIKSLEQQIVSLQAKVAEQTESLASLVGEYEGDEDVRGLLSTMIQQLDTQRDQPMMALIVKLEDEKRALSTERHDQLTTQANLTVERDLMHTTLSTLQSEVMELKLRVASAPSSVRLASRAVLPSDSAWPAAPLVGGSSLIVGFLAALVLVPLASAMGWQPPLGRRFGPVEGR